MHGENNNLVNIADPCTLSTQNSISSLGIKPGFRLLNLSRSVLVNLIIMDKVKHYCGIDVSKDTFDTKSSLRGHIVYGNDLNGFKKLLKDSSKETHFVMEATGVYHEQLAHFIYAKGYCVSVVNSLVIKRYAQMLLRATKTDKSDAEMIFKYACDQHPEPWEPLPEYISCCKDLNGILVLLLKQRTALKNKLHSLKSKGSKDSLGLRSVKQSIKSLNHQIERLEHQMEQLIVDHEPDMYNHLKTIPGIGRKTAVFLIVITAGFKGFETSKQLSSFLGLSPSIRTSGTSIRGQSRITKSGNGHIRNLLFLSSFSAYKYNPACKAIFDRITEKGKSKKLALIAVANKLLKQAFAIAKSGKNYDPEYISIHPALR
jgi:transposase